MVIIWLAVNVLLIIGMVTWSFLQETNGFGLQIATLFSQAAVILVLFNINMYFIFLLIRKSTKRKTKLTLAKASRTIMKYHIPIAITATSLIILHITFILMNISFDTSSIKMWFGLIAACCLVFTLFAGYLRKRRASGHRRKFHIITAFIFLTFVLLHIFSQS
ncbi:hypothetical protein [Neobacillus sp. D3-1R]|uniref:hypothetical protein n=1 Tax=Neobacillus sp. D3-1R TaxID=3445778 RepID=UPI003F9F5043